MESILLLWPIIIYRRLHMQTVENYSTAGLLVGEWSFTLKIIIGNLIFNVEKENLTIHNFLKHLFI